MNAVQIDRGQRFHRTVTLHAVDPDHPDAEYCLRSYFAELQERFENGFDVLRLDTNKVLTAAIGLYHSYGFREVGAFNDDPYAHHWFEKRIEKRATGRFRPGAGP
jgi:hypothetical protein